MATLKAQPDLFNIAQLGGGERPDAGDNVALPALYRLLNFYYATPQELRGRPHCSPHLENVGQIKGLARAADNSLLYLAAGNLYGPDGLIGPMTGVGDLVFAHMRDRTILAAGENAYQYNSDGSLVDLEIPNIYVVETGYGPAYDRAIYVGRGDRKQAYYSNWGVAGDLGTVIPGAIEDEWTEGGAMDPTAYDIIDIHLFGGEWVIFTAQAIYITRFAYDEHGFDPVTRRQFDINILDVRPVRFAGGVFLMSDRGLIAYSIGEQGPTVGGDNVNQGILRTLMSQLVPAEARMNVDDTRGLVFIKPNNTFGYTWVLSRATGTWSRWNVRVENAVTISGITYITLTGDQTVYILNDTGGEGYDFSIQTGLVTCGSPNFRKRWRTIGLCTVHDSIIDVALKVIAENIVPGETPIRKTYQPEVSRIEQGTGAHGRRASLLVDGFNRGELIIPIGDEANPPLYTELLVKKPKTPKGFGSAAD